MIMTVVKVAIFVVAYVFCMFVYGIMGPATNIECGTNQQHWWEAPLWPLGLLYRMFGGQ